MWHTRAQQAWAGEGITINGCCIKREREVWQQKPSKSMKTCSWVKAACKGGVKTRKVMVEMQGTAQTLPAGGLTSTSRISYQTMETHSNYSSQSPLVFWIASTHTPTPAPQKMQGNAKHNCHESNLVRQLLWWSKGIKGFGPLCCFCPFKHPAQHGCCELHQEDERRALQSHLKQKERPFFKQVAFLCFERKKTD